MMRKTYKFRLYPTVKQEITLISTLNTCRFLYNNSLAERIKQSKTNKLYNYLNLFPLGKFKYINYYDQQKLLKVNKNQYQKKVYSQILQNVIRRVDRSFKNFFNGYGYPRFQGKNRYDSFTYTQSGFSIIDNKLKLSKIGLIKIVKHREIEGKIKTCTIKRDINQWYVLFSCEFEPIALELTGKSVGIDVGLLSLITLDDGTKISPPKYLHKSEHKLIKVQKSLFYKQKGSSNRNKQRLRLAKIHRKIRNQRQDFAHKLSNSLINKYDNIIFEKLQIKNMIKNHHLAKSILDASWNQLITFTTYKAEYAGKHIELVNPKNTSKKCSICGKIQNMPLNKRTYICSCGNHLDRDHNAAINILNRAVGTTVKACGVVSMDTTMKQEALSERIG